MNLKELIDALAAKTGSTKVEAGRNIAALLDIVTATLKKGANIALVGFGTFEVRKRVARNGRNPSKGDAIKIKAAKVPAAAAVARAYDRCDLTLTVPDNHSTQSK